MANTTEAIEQVIGHCELIHGDHAVIEQAKKELAQVKGLIIAEETAKLDRHTICEIGALYWGDDKQCYSADAVLRRVQEQQQQFNDIKLRHEKLVARLENLVTEARK